MKYRFQQNAHSKVKKVKRNFKRRAFLFLQKVFALGFLLLDLLIIAPNELYNDIKVAVINFEQDIDLQLSEIHIEGNHKVSLEAIQDLMNLKIGDNILSLNLEQIRNNIESNKWIAKAIVERILPSTIKVSIEEEKAKAIYIQNQKTFFINEEGKIIEEVNDYNLSRNYIYLIGEKANTSYAEILDYLYPNDLLYNKIEGLIKINERRWDVKLKDNITLKLPESNLESNLLIFEEILQKNSLLEYPCVIDLRLLPDKIYIKF
jgi:cell division protein FtsQ